MPSTVKRDRGIFVQGRHDLTAALVLVMSQGLREVAGDDDEGIPLRALAGRYSSTATALMPFALILKTTSPR